MNATAITQDRAPQEVTRSRRVGFLVYPDFQILDVSGPLEAFFFAGIALQRFGRTNEAGYQCVVLATTPGPVRTTGGIEIVAAQSCFDIRDGLDTLVVAGGLGVEQACKDPSLIEWVRSMAPRVRRMVSICTGAFILAAAGLLDHRRVTTHWMFSELLARTFPSTRVDSNLLFARDGKIYSSGGITAGIDLALVLLEEDLGQEIALAVAQAMVVFPRRPGGQSQFRPYLNHLEVKSRPDISELHAWILENPGHDVSVTALADRMAMSPRNFARLLRSETGMKPAQFTEWARADAARCKLVQTISSVETIAVQCGFGNAERMRHTFQRLFDISPHDYRARFRPCSLDTGDERGGASFEQGGSAV
jgi:transcriptional regulator GlxA family with amidase domain